MGFTFINKLPTPAEIREQFPLAPELAEIKHARDEEIKKVAFENKTRTKDRTYTDEGYLDRKSVV